MEQAQKPVVSFVTVNYKTPHFIRQLLQGVQDAKFTFPFEYFLVDNDSHDGVLEMVRKEFPWATAIDAGYNSGFAVGNNLGITRSSGKYIVPLNPDLTVFPGEMEKWIAWMDAHPEVGISGPRIFSPDGTDQDSCYRFHSLMTPVYRRTPLGKLPWAKRAIENLLMKGMDRTKEQEVDWVLGAALCVRREVFEKIGGFDERFFMYFEDEDWCRRAWEKGFRVAYTPVASFTHYYRRQSRIKRPWEVFTNRVTRIHIESGVKYFWKYFRQPNPRLAREEG
jgi:GT2 family glycosyltransferase